MLRHPLKLDEFLNKQKWFNDLERALCRFAISLHVNWDFNVANSYGILRWVFDCEGAYETEHKGNRVFWLRGWIRILGFYLGGGIFYSKGEK